MKHIKLKLLWKLWSSSKVIKMFPTPLPYKNRKKETSVNIFHTQPGSVQIAEKIHSLADSNFAREWYEMTESYKVCLRQKCSPSIWRLLKVIGLRRLCQRCLPKVERNRVLQSTVNLASFEKIVEFIPWNDGIRTWVLKNNCFFILGG